MSLKHVNTDYWFRFTLRHASRHYNGILFSESAQKGAHFIELSAIFHCYSYKTLRALWLVWKWRDCKKRCKTGDGSCNVPKLTLIIGGSFGAGNYVAVLIHHAFYGHGQTLVYGRRTSSERTVNFKTWSDKGAEWSAQQEDEFKQPIRTSAKAIHIMRLPAFGMTGSSSNSPST